MSTKFSPLRRACVPYQMHNNVDLKIPQPSPTGFHTPLFFFFTEDPAYHCTYYTIQQTLPTIARTTPFRRPCLPLHVLNHSAEILPTIARTTPFSRPCLPLHILHHSADPAYHCTYYTIQQRPCLPLHVLHHSAETLPTIARTTPFSRDPAYWTVHFDNSVVCHCIALAEGGGGGGGGEGGHSEIQPSPLLEIRSIGDAYHK